MSERLLVKLSGRQKMDGSRTVLVCPAALSDLRMLLPRPSSQAIMIRHAMKLKSWTKERRLALDLEVAEIPKSVIRELCVGDHFGFCCGVRLAFFETVLTTPDSEIWVIGSRREDESLSRLMMETLNHRMEIIERERE